MSSDRARKTYDPRLQYRGVVMQQGRVTLEADWNEQDEISREALRDDALDIVGPCGTPDDGYAISASSNRKRDFSIGKGTMYVGGERLSLGEDTTYLGQVELDWVDGPDPASTDATIEAVSLYVREQEVSAVEDPDLREVALGGPDSAQRWRFLQRVQRLGVGSPVCDKAWEQVVEKWAGRGFKFDPSDMRLRSNGRLKVIFTEPTNKVDLCEPLTHGGYLGADNQVIQVKVVGYDSTSKTVQLVWGIDNASFLYRVSAVKGNVNAVVLGRPPVDTEHWPKSPQVAEILRSAAALPNGGFVAEHTGFVANVDTFDPDSLTVTLSDDVSAYFADAKIPTYLRMWEGAARVKLGNAMTLGDTGLQVEVRRADTTLGIPVGDFWCFAVRPLTPAWVYPERYLDEAQPPEGPRQWLCELATIDWTGQSPIVQDCRERFDNLVELTKRRSGCCSVVIYPADAPKLQKIVDRFRLLGDDERQATICFMPGDYVLEEPLVLGKDHSFLSLEACHGGVVFRADKSDNPAFTHGLVRLNGLRSVTIRGISFELPLAAIGHLEKQATHLDVSHVLEAFNEKAALSLGIVGMEVSDLKIEDCAFRLPGSNEAEDLISVGVLLGGIVAQLRVEGNSFVRRAKGQDDRTPTVFGGRPPAAAILHSEAGRVIAETPGTRVAPGRTHAAAGSTRPAAGSSSAHAPGRETHEEAGEPPFATQVAIGLAIVPFIQRLKPDAAGHGSARVFLAQVDETEISDNFFQGLTMGTFALPDLGRCRIADNRVVDCRFGFIVRSILDSLFRAKIGDFKVTYAENQPELVVAFVQNLFSPATNADSLVSFASLRALPLPESFSSELSVNIPADRVDVEPDFEDGGTFLQQYFGEGEDKLFQAPLKDISASINSVARRFPQFARLEDKVGAVERQAVAERFRHLLTSRLHVNDNEFDETAPGEGQSLNLLAFSPEGASSLMLDANYISRAGIGHCVRLSGFYRTTVTGNQILNESGQDGTASLQVDVPKSGLVAIAGNVIGGISNLWSIRRGYNAPFDDWRPFNELK